MKTAKDRVELREIPRYTVPEAAHYLSMSKNTLRSWVAGRKYPVAAGIKYWKPLVQRPEPDDSRLSFTNLVELYVLQALRTEYHVGISEIRTAIEFTRENHGIERFLLSRQLRVIPGNLFLDELDRLVNVGRAGQEAMRDILESYLERILWDEKGLPLQLFPMTRSWSAVDSPRLVTIIPEIAFGRPVVQGKFVKTATIAERFKAGESVVGLADDYGLEVLEIEEAIRYEQPALAA